MSYLELPRLHFRGRFFSDPSTRNNRKEWYPPDADTSDDPYRQNWNPGGEHRFELRGCRVGAAWNRAGALLRGEGEDPLLGGEVATPTDQGSLGCAPPIACSISAVEATSRVIGVT